MSALTDYLETLASRSAARWKPLPAGGSLVPEAEDSEGVSYGMPALRYRRQGRWSALKVTAKGHIGLFPFSPEAIDPVRDELAGFDLAKGTIRFTADHPIPGEVLDRVIMARRAQIDR